MSLRLDWLGLTHNSSYVPMLRRIAGSDDISALKVLADVVEPVKDYTREQTATGARHQRQAAESGGGRGASGKRGGATVCRCREHTCRGQLQPGTEARVRTLLNPGATTSLSFSPCLKNLSC